MSDKISEITHRHEIAELCSTDHKDAISPFEAQPHAFLEDAHRDRGVLLGLLSAQEPRLHRTGGATVTRIVDTLDPREVDAIIRRGLESKQEALLMGCDRGEGDQSRDGASAERASLGSNGTISNERRPGQGPGGSGQGQESGEEPVRPPRRVDDPYGHPAPPEASQAVGPAYRRVYVIDDPRRSLAVKALELGFMYGGNPWKFGPRCYRKKD